MFPSPCYSVTRGWWPSSPVTDRSPCWWRWSSRIADLVLLPFRQMGLHPPPLVASTDHTLNSCAPPFWERYENSYVTMKCLLSWKFEGLIQLQTQSMPIWSVPLTHCGSFSLVSYLVVITMMSTSCSQIMRQKSGNVRGNGPTITQNKYKLHSNLQLNWQISRERVHPLMDKKKEKKVSPLEPSDAETWIFWVY